MPRQKTTAPKKFCFVLMPFKKEFDDVYELGIKAACQEAGVYCERVDEQDFHERILDRIYNQISTADMIVADMSGQNPNVFYEVGYAHALGKRVTLLTRNVADIPFDLNQFGHIVYSEGIATLRDKLASRLKWYVDNPPESDARAQVDIEMFSGATRLIAGGQVNELKAISDYNKYLVFTAHNTSPATYSEDDFRVTLITPKVRMWLTPDGQLENEYESIDLPDGRVMHRFPKKDQLLPGDVQKYLACFLGIDSRTPSILATLRLFTSMGVRDYELSILFA